MLLCYKQDTVHLIFFQAERIHCIWNKEENVIGKFRALKLIP